jgi:predicted HTH domain antitoxin
MNEIVVSWLTQALKLEEGEQLLLEAKTKYAQRQTFERFKKVLERLKELNEDFSTLSLSMDLGRSGSKLWVIISKLSPPPKVGFVRHSNGTLSKTSFYEKEVIRRVALMLQDGISKEEIAELEGMSLEDVKELVMICCSTDENLRNFPQGEEDGRTKDAE